MAISFLGQTWVPAADNATTPLGSSTPHSITPPASMISGDVVLVFVTARNNTVPAVSNAGGQTWTSHTENTNGTTIIGRLFSCVYNGTWSANPSFTTGSTADGVCLWMGVYRGVDNSSIFDVSPTNLDLASSTSHTLTGFNTNTNAAWAHFIWGEPDDNALTGQDAGWTGPNGSTGALNDHVGNQGGSDIGLFISKKTQALAGATGDNVVAVSTADLGAGYYFALKPEIQSSQIAVGNITAGTAGTGAGPFTLTHNNNGDFLVATVAYRDDADNTLTATYNGVSMTSAISRITSGGSILKAQIFYLANPASGSNTLSISSSGSILDVLGFGCMSLTGVRNSNPIDATASDGQTPGSEDPRTTNITTARDGSLIVDCISDRASDATKLADQTLIHSLGTGDIMGASYKTTTASSTYAMGWDPSAGQAPEDWSQVIVAFASITVKNNSVKANIKQTYTVDNSVKANTSSSVSATTKDNSVKANILNIYSSNNSVKANVKQTYTSDNSVKSDIKNTYTVDQSVKSNIKATYSQDQSVKVNILSTYSSAQSVKANIKDTYSSSNSVKSNIRNTYTSDQSVKSNILNTYSQNDFVKTNILTTYSSDNFVKINIKQVYSFDQSIRASITALITTSQSVKANIVNTYSNNQSVKADIKNTYTFDNSVKVNVKQVYSFDQSVKSNIRNIYSNDQSVKANILNTYSNNQNVKSNIKNTYDQSNSIKANILSLYTQEQSVKANIRAIESKINDTKASVETGVVIPVSADAYVRSGTFANTNLGSSAEIAIKRDPADYITGDFNRKGLVKFDLSSYRGRDVRKAYLYLYTSVINTGVPITFAVTEINDDSWVEGTVTWNNSTGIFSTEITQWILRSDTTDLNKWVAFDVTNFTQQALWELTSNLVSFGLVGVTSGSQTNISFASKENGDSTLAPYLLLLLQPAHDNSVKANIVSVYSQNQSVKTNILVTGNVASNSVKSNLKQTYIFDSSVKANILSTYEQTASVKANIKQTYIVDNSVKADIASGLAEITKNNSVKANILNAYEQLSSVKANIKNIYSSDNFVKSNILQSYSSDQSSKANIVRTYSQDNSVKANVKNIYSQEQSSKGNILNSYSYDTNVKTNILNTYSSNLSVKGNILNTQVADNSVRASISTGNSYSNSVKANIKNTYSSDQSVKINILVPGSPRRYNLCANPSIETTASTFWNGSASRSSDFARLGSYSAKTNSTFSNGSITSGHNYLNTLNPFYPIPGRTYRFTVYVYVPTGSPITRVFMGIRRHADWVYLSSIVSVYTTPGQWVRGTASYTAVDTTPFRFTVADPQATGFTGVAAYYVDSILIEETSSDLDYFDGSFDGAAWFGTAHTTESYYQGAVQSVKANITATSQQNSSVKSNIKNTYTSDNDTKVNILNTYQNVSSVKANIYSVVTYEYSQSVKANLLKINSYSQSVKARIRNVRRIYTQQLPHPFVTKNQPYSEIKNVYRSSSNKYVKKSSPYSERI